IPDVLLHQQIQQGQDVFIFLQSKSCKSSVVEVLVFCGQLERREKRDLTNHVNCGLMFEEKFFKQLLSEEMLVLSEKSGCCLLASGDQGKQQREMKALSGPWMSMRERPISDASREEHRLNRGRRSVPLSMMVALQHLAKVRQESRDQAHPCKGWLVGIASVKQHSHQGAGWRRNSTFVPMA
ncbi:hypothetical protein DV515_00004902, partial [Chloebia gouldiae]